MNTKKKLIVYLGIACFILILCGVTGLFRDFARMISSYHSKPIAERRAIAAKEATGPITIGAVAPWAMIPNVGDLWRGIEYAADELNSNGGILQRKIVIVKHDDRANVREGELIAKDLSDDLNVDVVIGLFLSEVAIKSSVIYQNRGVLTVSSASLDPMLTKRPGYPLVFRCSANAADYADELATFLKKNNIHDLIIYGQDDLYAKTTMSDHFETFAFANDLNIVDRQKFYSQLNQNYVLRQLREWRDFYKFDAIFFDGAPEVIADVIQLARKEGIDTLFLSYDNCDNPSFLKQLKGPVGTLVVSSCFNPQSERAKVRQFVSGFQRKYGKEPTMFAAHGYDTLMSVAAAIEQAKSTVPTDIAEALRNLDYNGVSVAPLSYSPQGDLKNAGVILKRLNDKTKTYEVIENTEIPGIYKKPAPPKRPDDDDMGPPPGGKPPGPGEGQSPQQMFPQPPPPKGNQNTDDNDEAKG